MRRNPTNIIAATVDELDDHLAGLCRVLRQSVNDGGAIGFLAPLSEAVALKFWTESVRPEMEAGHRILFIALSGGELAGTTQLITHLPANQPHRCELAKMMVLPEQRRKGIGRALIHAALDAARVQNKSLITLDTKSGDAAEILYKSAGFEKIGEIPDYALDTDRQAHHATSYMYRRI